MRIRTCLGLIAMAGVLPAALAAQAPAGAAAQPPRPALTLTTTAFADGTPIPAKYTQAGDQVSPALAWTNVPEGTQSFVLHMRAPDALVKITPPIVPFPHAVALITGWLELAGAVGLLWPRTRRLAGILLALASVRADRQVIAGMLVAIGMAEGWVARRTVKVWSDELDLWVLVAERASAGNVGPRAALAGVVRDRGGAELACPLWQSALKELDATGRHATPAYKRNSENLAACYGIIGRYDASVALYLATLAEYPQDGRVALGLGYAHLHRLDFQASSSAFARAGELSLSLRPLATKMREEVEVAEHERTTLEGTDRSKRARYLESVGRSIEAEREWLAVAKDASLPNPLRVEAAGALLSIGSAKSAREATTAIGDHDLEAFVAQKELRARKLEELTPQLRYLAP